MVKKCTGCGFKENPNAVKHCQKCRLPFFKHKFEKINKQIKKFTWKR